MGEQQEFHINPFLGGLVTSFVLSSINYPWLAVREWHKSQPGEGGPDSEEEIWDILCSEVWVWAAGSPGTHAVLAQASFFIAAAWCGSEPETCKTTSLASCHVDGSSLGLAELDSAWVPRVSALQQYTGNCGASTLRINPSKPWGAAQGRLWKSHPLLLN